MLGCSPLFHSHCAEIISFVSSLISYGPNDITDAFKSTINLTRKYIDKNIVQCPTMISYFLNTYLDYILL